MKIAFNKYPIDIVLCMLWSITLLPIALLDTGGIIRIILGLPFIVFIPGYTLIAALFPAKKTSKGIDIIERIALSFGLSIAVVPLIGLGLNYTSWGIRLESILLSLFIYGTCMSTIAVNRWFRTKPNERFTISFDMSLPKSESKLDRMLTVILVISIMLVLVIATYAIITPQKREQFTQFYLLDPNGDTERYQKNLTVGNNATGIIGIVNHEYKTVSYTVEIWLINQSTIFNETEKENKTIINHMWFVDNIITTVEHTDIEDEKPWTTVWEYSYSYPMDRTGSFRLTFLLFTTPTENYNYSKDYNDIAENKISSAYRETHLWIDVY